MTVLTGMQTAEAEGEEEEEVVMVAAWGGVNVIS